MTGSLDELGEFGRRDDGFAAVVLVPQFVDGDRATVAAYREYGIIAYVQARGQIRAERARHGQTRAGDDETPLADVGESAGIRRRDRADQVVDLLRGLRPVDAAVFRLAPAVVAALRQIVRQMRRFARQQRR